MSLAPDLPGLHGPCRPQGSGGPWAYWRPAGSGLVELGTVRGREVALPPHFHDEDQLSFVLAGQRRFLIGGGVRCVGPGQATSIPAGTPHRSLSESEDVACVNLYLAPGCCAVEALVAALCRLWRRGPGFGGADLSALVAAHCSAPPLRPGAGTDAAACLERPGTVRQAAREAGLSREGYSRRFKQLHGVPPDAFRLLVQLNAARGLLRAGQPIAAVAADTGFADQSHLGRCFRRFFGVTPGRYRAG